MRNSWRNWRTEWAALDLTALALIAIASYVVAAEPATTAPASAPSTDAPPPAAAPAESPAKDDSAGAKTAKPKAVSPDPPDAIRLLPDKEAWIDPKHKRVIVDGTVCLREGQLEMFACPKGTKEHESIVSIDTPAYALHAALMKLGAKPGKPVNFRPKYEPATGDKIDVTCIWTDPQGKVHRERAQDWVQEAKSQKAMDLPWVFAGSKFWDDETTGEKHYGADGGYLICLSNFPAAMLDVPVESSEQNADLLFVAYKDHIPPKGTRVRLVLSPHQDAKEQ